MTRATRYEASYDKVCICVSSIACMVWCKGHSVTQRFMIVEIQATVINREGSVSSTRDIHTKQPHNESECGQGVATRVCNDDVTHSLTRSLCLEKEVNKVWDVYLSMCVDLDVLQQIIHLGER